MREILFRAWDGFSGCYYKGGIRAATFAGKYTFDVRERFVLEQFTGILDKKGNKIFEGDIVEVANTLSPAQRVMVDHVFGKGTAGKTYLGYVKYDENEGTFFLVSYGERPNRFGGYTAPVGTFEVVGNIHDNPELLEEESHEAT